MNSNNSSDSSDDEQVGVLDESASLDTTSLGVIGMTAQVNVVIPQDDDDDLVDDEVVDGELPAELVLDGPVIDPSAGEQPVAADVVVESSAVESEAVEEPLLAPIVIEVAPEEAVDEPAVLAEPVIEDEPAATASETVAPSKRSSSESATSAWITAAMKQSAPAPVEEPVIDEPVDVEPVVEEPVADVPVVDDPSVPERTSAESADEEKSAPTDPIVPESPLDNEMTYQPVSTPSERSEPTERALTQRPATPRPEVAMTSKRLGEQLGQSARESADLLTADRLLDPRQMTKPEPEGGWSHFLYSISGHRINIGDGKRARERKALSARIAAPIAGGARFVPVLSRKGGVGKTTITTLLGMALADARNDRVIAVDANPDRGTLADRVARAQSRSIRDLARIHDEITGYHDISAIVARDTTRLDVLASDSDPRIADAFSDEDYRDVAEVAARYYSLVLTDTGTGIVHSVMGATLDLADQIVIVSGLSVDEARLASETLTWLESNGYEEKARNAIIVLNQSTPGSPLVRLNELEAHFGTRAKSVVRMPYDAQIAGGGPIVYSNLQVETRRAARELAALLIDGLRTSGV